MHAIKRARKFIAENPHSDDARTLAKLVVSLESDTPFLLKDLYEVNLDVFELAVGVLKDWRLDRYYAGKGRLFDVAAYLDDISARPSA